MHTSPKKLWDPCAQVPLNQILNVPPKVILFIDSLGVLETCRKATHLEVPCQAYSWLGTLTCWTSIFVQYLSWNLHVGLPQIFYQFTLFRFIILWRFAKLNFDDHSCNSFVHTKICPRTPCILLWESPHQLKRFVIISCFNQKHRANNLE